jgi:hypothetical protein
MTDEQRKDLEGSGRDLIEVLSRNFPDRIDDNYVKSQPG